MLDHLTMVRESFSVAFADRVRAREREGGRILKLQTGDPDFPTHENVVRAAGTNHMLTVQTLRSMAAELGFELRQRDFLYRPFTPPARPLQATA